MALAALAALAAPAAAPLGAQDSTPPTPRPAASAPSSPAPAPAPAPPTRSRVRPAARPAARPAPQHTDADSVVRRLRVVAALDSFVVAFNDLDSARFAARWAAQSSAFFPFADTPQRVDGRDALLARFATFFAQVRRARSGPPYLRIVPRGLDVRLLGPDAALATFTMQVADGGTARRTVVLVREGDGAWRIAHLHASGAVGGR